MVLLINTMGFIGAALLLLGYYCVSKKHLRATGVRYQWLNIIGSLGILVNAWYYGAMPSVAINLMAIGIGLHLLTFGKKTRRRKRYVDFN